MTRLALLLALIASPALADPSVTVAFSPSGGGTEAVVAVIAEAHTSVHLAGYGFTSKPIAEALIAAHQRGVDVELVLDKSNATARFTEAKDVAAAGVPVRIDSRYAIMHSKYMVLDGMMVETGSMNHTRSGSEMNAENVIVLRVYPEVAARYETNWEALWAESEAYQP